MFEQQVEHGELAPLAGHVQRRDGVLGGARGVRAGGQQRARHARVPVVRRDVQRREPRLGARVRVVLVL